MSSFWFSSILVGYPVSGTWLSKQCWVWVQPHGVGLKSGIGWLFCKFCASTVLAYLVGRVPLENRMFGACLVLVSHLVALKVFF